MRASSKPHAGAREPSRSSRHGPGPHIELLIIIIIIITTNIHPLAGGHPSGPGCSIDHSILLARGLTGPQPTKFLRQMCVCSKVDWGHPSEACSSFRFYQRGGRPVQDSWFGVTSGRPHPSLPSPAKHQRGGHPALKRIITKCEGGELRVR